MVDVVLSGTYVLNDKGEVFLLHRKEYGYYEKPGGKLEQTDTQNFQFPTVDELLNRALIELDEEVDDLHAENFRYGGFVDVIIPGGRTARAHAFIADYVRGNPRPKETHFDAAVFLAVAALENYSLAPDLKIFLPKLKEYVKKN